MTRRDRKPHQQGGLLLWEQPLRRIKGSQLLTLEEGTGAQGGELVQDAVASLQKKPQAWRLASFLSPAHGLFLLHQGRGQSGGAFQEPRPTTPRESAEFPIGTPRATGIGGDLAHPDSGISSI